MRAASPIHLAHNGNQQGRVAHGHERIVYEHRLSTGENGPDRLGDSLRFFSPQRSSAFAAGQVKRQVKPEGA
jgi:hypothetical protein